jgi:hypothetical protein
VAVYTKLRKRVEVSHFEDLLVFLRDSFFLQSSSCTPPPDTVRICPLIQPSEFGNRPVHGCREVLCLARCRTRRTRPSGTDNLCRNGSAAYRHLLGAGNGYGRRHGLPKCSQEDMPDRRLQVSLKSFSAESDPQTQTYEVVLGLVRPKDVTVLPGMSAEVFPEAAVAGSATSNLVVPLKAVFAGPDGTPLVWVVDPEGSRVPFEFMAILGFLSLIGMLVKNSIVLVDQADAEIREGKARFVAVLDASVSRARPVCLGALTTILGVAPLLADPFFNSMAVTIMFGLGFATILTLVVVPLLYVVLFRIRPSGLA